MLELVCELCINFIIFQLICVIYIMGDNRKEYYYLEALQMS